MELFKKYRILLCGILLGAGVVSIFQLPRVVQAATTIFSSPVSNVREANRIPYQKQVVITCPSVNPNCSGHIAADVPTGYQLVVDHISISVRTSSSTTALSGEVDNEMGGFLSAFALSAGGQDNSADPIFAATQSVKIVVPHGSFALAGVNGGAGGNFPNGDFVVGVTGYLESCAAYPGGVCPAPSEI